MTFGSHTSHHVLLFVLLINLLLFVVIFMYLTIFEEDGDGVQPSQTYRNSFEHEIFKQLDVDRNGVLSFKEFAVFLPSACKILSRPSNDAEERAEVPNESNASVTIEAFLEPVVLESFKKDFKNVAPTHLGTLKNFLSWRKPATSNRTFYNSQFSAFLPHKGVRVGDTWWVIPPVQADYLDGLSNLKYDAPKVKPPLALFHNLMSMFFPNPFLITRAAPRGTVALLKSSSKEFFEIFFRMHVEFQLNRPPNYPFWFTPAQFRGAIVISKDASQILDFSLEVPVDRRVNVDLEWMTGPSEKDDMEVDIGFIPEMQLTLSLPQNTSDINWDERIDVLKAHQRLDQEMYPFLKVTYHNLSSALEEALSKDKLIHSVLLWGALDDQSC